MFAHSFCIDTPTYRPHTCGQTKLGQRSPLADAVGYVDSG